MTTTTPARRRARIAAALTLGTALAVAAPLAASAHVHVTPEESAAGASTRLTFSFSHGCDGAPTTALVVTVPEGVDGVTPVYDGAWTVAREVGDDGIPTKVTFTAARPIDDGLSASAAIDVIFASSAADTSVAFPVLQQCSTGETDWAQVAEEGQDPHDLEAPAPVVAVGAVAEQGDDHGHSDSSDVADAEHADADAAPSSDGSDPVARWLSGGALVAGLAALAVTLVRRRRA